MIQMVTRARKPLGRPKIARPTAKLNNTTIRDFGGGLNVVDSEQNLVSKFSPVFDNMISYTDRRVGPRNGYEMFLKLKQGLESSGTANIEISTTAQSRIVRIHWVGHPITNVTTPFDDLQHITISGWNGVTAGDDNYNGIFPAMINRVHGIWTYVDANHFEIVVSNSATATASWSPTDSINWKRDTHMLGGEPVECTYFDNVVVVWTSNGEIFTVTRDKLVKRIWSAQAAQDITTKPIPWAYTDHVAFDIFGTELICSNGRDKPLTINFARMSTDVPPKSLPVKYLYDSVGGVPDNSQVPAFDACKSAFRYFTIHDTDPTSSAEFRTFMRVAAKDTAMVFGGATDPQDAVDIDISKVSASPEQTIRGFAMIKDALLVITPTATTMMKLGNLAELGDGTVHDPVPIDTLQGFGSNAPRSIVSIGSDVFMVDFNGVPSAKLSTVSNAVVPERVSNYIETMMSKHIGRLLKETMRLKTFGFYDGKNKCVHFYLPKYDTTTPPLVTVTDPFYFDSDMAKHDFMKNTLILRLDDHQLEKGDLVDIKDATGFSTITAAQINGIRKIAGVLSDNYILIEIAINLPILSSDADVSGGGPSVSVMPINDGSIGYIYHYVPQLKLFAWSRFKTDQYLRFNCGCGTIEGRSFLFTPDGYMMRYGSADHRVHADWIGMYDFPSWSSTVPYNMYSRVFDNVDGLVYQALEDVPATAAANFAAARALAPDAWQEYKGEPIKFAWELPWSDFGGRQQTKDLRFVHIDANGNAEFKLSLFSDNIYKDAASGQLIPSRELTFVPNDAGAYGNLYQVYGAGRRTREQRLWQMPVKCKLLKPRISGATTEPLSISAISFLPQGFTSSRVVDKHADMCYKKPTFRRTQAARVCWLYSRFKTVAILW